MKHPKPPKHPKPRKIRVPNHTVDAPAAPEDDAGVSLIIDEKTVEIIREFGGAPRKFVSDEDKLRYIQIHDPKWTPQN